MSGAHPDGIMSRGVFVHRADSIYDDAPFDRYHFPSQYLLRARACIGDWIVYYEPRAVIGSRGYFAIAKVNDVVPDRRNHGMFYALIEPGSYLDFACPVPFRDNAGDRAERDLRNGQHSVRALSAEDFERITHLGLGETFAEFMQPVGDSRVIEMGQTQAVYGEQPRERVAQFGSRIVRDRVFRSVVMEAYGERCAFTGLKLINGGGRAEAEAAHIRSVRQNGPDTVNNGIALSQTSHWMFDRGLITVADDLRILVSRQVNDVESISAHLNASGYMTLPARRVDHPHPQFLDWHRANCFKA